MLSCNQESKTGLLSGVQRLSVASSSLGFSSSFWQLASDGGTAIAAGSGGKRRCQGCAASQGFSNVGHEEGIAGQLKHVHTVLLVISQATSNEGLEIEKGVKKWTHHFVSMVNKTEDSLLKAILTLLYL